LRADVDNIAIPEGRVVGSRGHTKVKEFLAERLIQIGCLPYSGASFELSYNAGNKGFTNLIGVIPGTHPELPPILIGAHYDSVIAAPCADDNAAAVAICLSVGESLATYEGFERDVIIALFDAEEPPYFSTSRMGSQTFVKKQMDKRGVHAAIIMDLVGHDISIHPKSMGGVAAKIPIVGDMDIKVPRFHNLVFMTGCESHEDLQGMFDSCHLDDDNDLKVLPVRNEHVGDMSDHGAFRTNSIPYLFLSCGRWAHYHQKTDTPDRLNYEKMADIADLVECLCNSLCEVELKPSKQEADTTYLEALYMESVLGPATYRYLAKQIGSTKITTREELDAVATWLATAL